MKSKSKELDVDFIGGQGPLTQEEEKQISEYLNSQKLRKTKKTLKTGLSKRKKSLA